MQLYNYRCLVSHPSPKTTCVLARSGALVYPKLISTTSFYACAQYHSVFLPSEQLLLAMGLVALRHVRHSNWNFCRGKYALISENFLPNKTVMQIRNFMKNARGSKPNPLHQIVMDAYKEGVFVAEIRTDSDEASQTDIPLNWPEHVQPGWLKTLSRLHREGRIDVLAPTPTLCTALQRAPCTQLYFTPQPTLSSAMGSRTASPIVDVVGSGQLLRSTVVSGSQNDEGVGVDGYVVVDGTVDMEAQSVVQLAQAPQPLML
ncbi:CBN-GON-4 protein, partial [Aphelenchoides avenae]